MGSFCVVIGDVYEFGVVVVVVVKDCCCLCY